MCDQCAGLREQVAELERALDGAIWLKPRETKKIEQALNLTTGEAGLVLAIWMAGDEVLSRADLSNMIPDTGRGRPRLDPEFRDVQCISSWIERVRRKHGRDFFHTHSGKTGVRLSPAARERVTEVMACA